MSEVLTTSTDKAAVINVNSSSNKLTYFSSVDPSTRPVISNVIKYKFPYAGVHNLTVVDEASNFSVERAILVEDPIVSAIIANQTSSDCTEAISIDLTVPMGSNVNVKWNVINGKGR